MKNFRKLEIWKRSRQLAIDCYQLTDALPKNEMYGLVSQMNRCAVSISSNIAEGCARSSDLELKRFIEIALGSAFELETQLSIASEIYKIDTNNFQNELTQIQKMINAYRTKLKKTPNTKY